MSSGRFIIILVMWSGEWYINTRPLMESVLERRVRAGQWERQCPAAVWGPVWHRVCLDRSEPLTRDRYLPSERTPLLYDPSMRFPDNGGTAWPISTRSGEWTASRKSTALCCTTSTCMVPFTGKHINHLDLLHESLCDYDYYIIILTLSLHFQFNTKIQTKLNIQKTCRQREMCSIFLTTMKIQYNYTYILQ